MKGCVQWNPFTAEEISLKVMSGASQTRQMWIINDRLPHLDLHTVPSSL